jgi:hypothetical protein
MIVLLSIVGTFDSELSASDDFAPTLPVKTRHTATGTSFRSASAATRSWIAVDQEELDAAEEKRRRDLTALAGGFTLLFFAGAVGSYFYCRTRIEEEQGPEYTRVIAADDSFEFTSLRPES